MPWLETSPVDQRERFITDQQGGLYAMTELCARYGISRKTGYKWLARFTEDGRRGLQDRSRKFPLDSVGSLSYTPGVSKLRRLREQKGYSIRGLAKAARLDWMTVWRVETGRRQPTVATLKKLARALKVEVADLL